MPLNKETGVETKVYSETVEINMPLIENTFLTSLTKLAVILLHSQNFMHF